MRPWLGIGAGGLLVALLLAGIGLPTGAAQQAAWQPGKASGIADEVAFCQRWLQQAGVGASPLPGWTPVQVAQRCRTYLVHACQEAMYVGRFGIGPMAWWPPTAQSGACTQLQRDLTSKIQLARAATFGEPRLLPGASTWQPAYCPV